MPEQTILILDFGSQLTQLIARRVRAAGVYCEIVAGDSASGSIAARQPAGLILSGSQLSVTDKAALRPDPGIFELGVPILGICYGMQVMAQLLGGRVQAHSQREFGLATLRARGHSELLRDLQDSVNDQGHGLLKVWMSHGDQLESLPKGFRRIGNSATCPLAAMADPERRFYGLQFHPELSHTRQGSSILARFVRDICRCSGSWQMANFVPTVIERIRNQVGSDQVLLALSGGVDSSVAAALLQRALGEQLQCIFVDNGLLRLGEREQVEELMRTQLGVQLICVDASQRFLEKLQGVSDPEAKRKLIGAEFVEVFQEQARRLSQARWLAQGTIYPDVIESGGGVAGKASAIKSHHNVGGLPQSLNLRLLEPLRELFKDEVRALGRELGLPQQLLARQPFPGPGLAVRVLGAVDAAKLELLRQADAIYRYELERQGYMQQSSQAFAVFLPIKSVGVMGDGRSYQYTIALRAVATDDFMSADCVDLPIAFLKGVASRIVNEVAGINRVVYDLSSKPPATIEWE